MRLIQFISVIFILFILACNNNTNIENNTDKAKPVNALLPTDVTVRHLFPFHPQDEEWIKSFDYTKFIEDITSAAKEEKIKVYDFFGTYEINKIPMSMADLQINLTGGVDTVYIEDTETLDMQVKIIERGYPQEEINQIFFQRRMVS